MAHKLLLADDSVTIQRVIELTFADEDVDVTTVGDGQMAIDLLDSDPPDIILADVDMPKRDGYEVAAYVKSRPKLAHIPVVLLTGAFEPIDQARATAAGSSDVLAKPFEPQMVINRVKELLGKKRSEDGTHVSHDAGAPSAMQPAMGNPQPAGEGTQQPVSLDDYFDQLDAAFSNLQPGAPPPESADDMDWPSPSPAPAAAVEPEPVPPSPPASAIEVVPPAVVVAPVAPPVATAPKPAFAAPSAAAAVASKPVSSTFAAQPPVAPVASTFAPPSHAASADKSAERLVAPIAPSAPVAAKNPFANLSAAKAEAAARPAPGAPVITDEMIEEIVTRVIQRMTDRVIRETVADVVSQTAERLVQEEIERIRTGG
jgi:CheY-like chemotaxis protein